MIRSGHFAAARIETSCTELQERLGHLRDLASVRRLRLLDAVESQMVYIFISCTFKIFFSRMLSQYAFLKYVQYILISLT